MKFKELPEGYYFIHAVRNSVCVQRLENPETVPKYIIELETTKLIQDGRLYHKNGELLNDMEVEFKTYEDMRRERKEWSGSLSHITRALNKDEPLTGKALELALSFVTPLNPRPGDKFDEMSNSIAAKLKAGQPLDEYEHHMMVDVFLLHARLG